MKTLESSIKNLRIGNNEYINKIKKISERIVVLYGLNGAGKDSIKDKLLKKDKFIYSIKSTSREIKYNEIDGVHYHYISKKNLKLSLDNSIVSYSYLSNYYWDDAKEVYENLINNPDKYIILIMGNIIGFITFIEVLPDVHKFCILPSENEQDLFEELKSRMILRKRDNINEIEERLKVTIKTTIELKSVADKIIINKRGHLTDAVNDIIIYLNKQYNGITI